MIHVGMYNNIDLLIEDDMHVIIIENKIKSKINGTRHDVDSELAQSQLKKYIAKAHERAKQKDENDRFLPVDAAGIRADFSKFNGLTPAALRTTDIIDSRTGPFPQPGW